MSRCDNNLYNYAAFTFVTVGQLHDKSDNPFRIRKNVLNVDVVSYMQYIN